MKKLTLKFLREDLRTPFDLNVARIFYYFLFLNRIWSQIDYQTNRTYSYQLVSKEMWAPVGVFHFYPKDLLFSWGGVYLIYLIFCISLLFCMIGLWTRFFSIIAVVLSLFCLGYDNNHGTIFDSSTLPVVILFALALSNMSSSYSLESFFKSKKDQTQVKDRDLFWNQTILKLISTLLLFFYFTSGAQKIRISGLEWLQAETMSEGLLDMGHPLGVWLLQFPLIVKMLAVSSTFLQISCLLPIFLPRLIPLYVVILFFGFHVLLDMTLTKHFSIYTYTFVFLVPWTRLYIYLSRRKNNFIKNYSLSNLFQKDFMNKIFVIKFIVIAIILCFAISAPLLKKDLYPFSRTTMYAYPNTDDKGQCLRSFLFGIDRGNKKKLISWSEFRPISSYKINSLFERLYDENDHEKIKKVAIALKEKQPLLMRAGLNTFQHYKAISVERCFWKKCSLYVKRKGKNPDYCDGIVRYDF